MKFKLFGLIFDLRPLLHFAFAMWGGFAILGGLAIDRAPTWYTVLWAVSTVVLLCTQESIHKKLNLNNVVEVKSDETQQTCT